MVMKPKKRGGAYAMGSAINLGGGVYGTIGSPTSSSATSFYTANYGVISVNQTVKAGSTTIGKVDRVCFDSNSDVSRVNMQSYGNTVSHSLYSLSSSVSSPVSVSAKTAYSGTVIGNVRQVSATVSNPAGGTMTDMIVTNMQTQSGDSGACLYKSGLYGDEAVGILSFNGTSGGQAITVFSKISNI